MKKLLLLGAALAAASLFTACESSDSSDVTSCEIKVLGVRYAGMESTDDSYIRSECSEASESSLGLAEGIVGSGCPGGAKKTCDATMDGVAGTGYFYFDEAAESTCEELLSDEEDYDDEDDYGFTPDDDEYYMKALKKAAKK